MEKGTHGINEKSFEELSYADQARTLNAQILGVQNTINAHLRKADSEGMDAIKSREKYIMQLERIIKALR